MKKISYYRVSQRYYIYIIMIKNTIYKLKALEQKFSTYYQLLSPIRV